uniref:Uncharacterized protein n=1 Tax=Roseihalotalea indica TaxID=2867963 RepID=A0AA49GNJ5_9BACT|nr:hypothetical protein K4G66_26130 [Tunicatimonas sp. TK19036]
MNYSFAFFTTVFSFLGYVVMAQDELGLVFPDQKNWNVIEEGQPIKFTLNAKGGLSKNYTFKYKSDRELEITLEENGKFSWVPSYDLVSPEEGKKVIPVLFEVSTDGGQVASRQVEFMVHQKSRIPQLAELQPFFIKPDAENTYSVSVDSNDFSIQAEDNALPEGMTLSPTGDFRWKPTRDQFSKLRKEPLTISFHVQDKEYNDKEPGKLELLPASTSSREDEEKPEEALKLLLPRTSYWNVINEGEAFSLKLAARGGTDSNYSYKVLNADKLGLSYDTLGNIYWKPPYDFVNRLVDTRAAQVIFEVRNSKGESDRQVVDLLVNHVNRSPEIGELRNFYVSYGKENSYALNNTNAIVDPDDDPVVFKPLLSKMPQGMTLSAEGELKWEPSMSQYNRLQKEPLELPFIVEDQPYEAQTQGVLRIEVTQQDMPPIISMVPNQSHYSIREDEALNLKFYLSDPNGDTDISNFDFVADNNHIPRSSLRRNEPTQWEFNWEPGYDFFVEPGDTGTYQITFFVIDRSNQRQERTINVRVQDAENLVEKDQLLYNQYRTGLVRVMNLMDQLKDKQKAQQKEYKKARKGKKHRAITTASLGAITGLSPVVLSSEVQTQKYVSGVGGTTSMTIGSLEASNVIGKDASNIYENLSYINQKLGELQTQGNLFAGKYALSNSRRSGEFGDDLRKLILLLSLDKVTRLELDPSWENPRKASDKSIKETFPDFNPDPSRSPYINE